MTPVILLSVLVSWPVRVAVLGDRTGTPDDAEHAIAVEAAASLSPDIVLTVGDFVEGYGEASTALEDLAGRQFGYDPEASVEANRTAFDAIERWLD